MIPEEDEGLPLGKGELYDLLLNDGEQFILFNVKEVLDCGGLLLEQVYKSRKGGYESETRSVAFDFQPLEGKKVSFVLAPGGQLIEFKGFDGLPEIKTPLGWTFSGDQHLAAVGALFPVLPERSVKIGDTWNHMRESREAIPGGTRRTLYRYTYTLAEALEKDGFDCLRIIGNYARTVTDEGKPVDRTPVSRREGTGEEEWFFAHELGMVLSGKGEDVLESGRANGSGPAVTTTTSQLARLDGEWKIVNVLWELRDPAAPGL